MNRPSGRRADELRRVTITRNFTRHAEGSVLVEFGDTKVLCTDGVWGPLPSDVIPRAMGSGNVVQATPALLNQAEARGGANADNLSMIAIRWEDNYAEDTLGSVSTKTMPADSFTTQMEAFAKARKGTQPLPNLSDEDIERAIQEINAAIKKYSK